MPLAAAGSLANMEQSLDLYLYNTLEVQEGLAVHYFGDRRFIPPETAPWVHANYGNLNLQRQLGGRQVDNQHYGSLLLGSLDLVLAQHARNWPDRYRLSAVRDCVIPYFSEGVSIPVYDVPNDTATRIAEIQCLTLNENWLDDGSVTGLVQWGIQVGTRWLELRVV